MLKLIPALALLGAFAAPAFAGPCVALDYQEMKDMPVKDLVKEACKVRRAISSNLDDGIANIGSRPSERPNPTAHDNFEQCMGQSSRIKRVLQTKGVTGEIADLCEQQAAGKTITAPAEAK